MNSFKAIIRSFHQWTIGRWRLSNYDAVIGEVLQKKGLVTNEQLKKAIEEQGKRLDERGQADSLGQIVAELGYASEKNIIKAINAHYGLNVSSLEDDIKGLVKGQRLRIRPPRVPIWLQLSAVIICITLLMIFILSAFILERQREDLYQQTVKIGKVSVSYLANDAKIPLLQEDLLKLNVVIQNLKAVEGLVYGFIVDQHQKIVAHTEMAKAGALFKPWQQIQVPQKEGEITYFKHYLPPRQPVLNFERAIRWQDKKLGEVHLGISILFLENLIDKARIGIIKIAFGVLILGVIMSVYIGIRFSQPISKLVRATQQIGKKGAVPYQVKFGRNDELGNLASAFNRMSKDLWKNALMQDSFGKYVGPEVLEMIMANPENIWLKGQRSQATVLFADIRGFTSYSDVREPEEVVDGLNEYFTIATKVILSHGGYIDKFIGDAVLAVFGVPMHRERHMERAVRAALDLQNELKRAAATGNPLLSKVGISIDSGIVVSGNIGSDVKMEYTVIGDCVNLAANVNNMAKSGEVIVSERIYRELKEWLSADALEPCKIKGIADSIIFYKVIHIIT
jgi:adenylate cyclase